VYLPGAWRRAAKNEKASFGKRINTPLHRLCGTLGGGDVRPLDPAVSLMPGLSRLRQQPQPVRNRASGEIMITNSFDGITRPPLPTLPDIQRRIAELESVQQQIAMKHRVSCHRVSWPRVPTEAWCESRRLRILADKEEHAAAPTHASRVRLLDCNECT
jgi:hypothetical protein